LALLRVRQQVDRLPLVDQQLEQQGRRGLLTVLQFLQASLVLVLQAAQLERWDLIPRLRVLSFQERQQPQVQLERLPYRLMRLPREQLLPE
jgi:hypothetical protein